MINQPLDDRRDVLNAEVPILLEEKHIQGLSLALIQDQKIILEMGFGVRNSLTGNPITIQSVFEAYSLTKPLVAYRALDLYQKGSFDLERPLENYTSEPCVYYDHRSKFITARTILCHTSGFPDVEPKQGFAFTPGTQWSYSTQGYGCLQRVLDQISCERFDEHMRRHVLDPFSMTSSSFVWEERFKSVLAQGHNAQGNPEHDRKIHLADADSLLTTASDYATFVAKCGWPDQMHSHDLNNQTSIQMIEPQVAISDSLSWGLGWDIEKTDDVPLSGTSVGDLVRHFRTS
jgi:CubicO group peptidase (beta-lactamase class C family)